MFGASVESLLHAAMRHPALEALAIIAGTFILEDAATVLTALQVQTATVPTVLALASLYVGIVVGDMGLYGLGRLAALVPWAQRLIPAQTAQNGERWLRGRLFRVVFASRFLPGARLPTYTACGFLGADFWRFTLATVVATLIWTSALFVVALQVGRVLLAHLGAWRWAGIAGTVLVVVIIGRLAARMQTAPP